MTIEGQAAILRGALLWLRNHYDASPSIAARYRPHAVARIDRVLKDHEPTIADVQAFREAYPRAVSEPERRRG